MCVCMSVCVCVCVCVCVHGVHEDMMEGIVCIMEC